MRAIKNLFAFAIILAVIAAGAAVALRVARGKPSPSEQVKANLVSVSAAGIYVYAARVGSKVILFDTGADPDGRPVDQALQGLGASRNDVSDVFLTHAHPDHAAGAAAFGNAKIHLGAGDVPMAEKKVEPGTLVPKLAGKVLAAPAVSVNAPIAGAATIDLGDGKTVKAFPMAGHTPGSYAFLYDGVLFAGDAMVYKQGRLDRSPKMLDHDSEQGKSAIKGLKTALADTEVESVCTGHGGCTPKGLGKNLLSDFVGRL
jgi:glyoxylase-like metal-dependent hydrolase (beta-lactamase superfamily II)